MKMSKIKMTMAAQQLLGYHHRNVGYEIEELCESMGLTEQEFCKTREDGMIDFLTEYEIEEIESTFCKA